MAPPKKRRFLFLHTTDATQHRTHNKSLDSKVRHHLMVDIGKSRRKPSKGPRFSTLVWPVDMTMAQPSTRKDENLITQDDHSQAHLKDFVAPYTAQIILRPPLIHALSAFEKEWGEDMFSAYGLTLMMVAGKNALGIDSLTNTFWFPFAFKKSAFLHHYQQLFASPDLLISLYLKSAGELRSLALERSLDTIQCVESRLASSDSRSATSDNVFDAVLALICYNFISLDFDQAMVHVKGICILIAARGGICALEANQDLIRMISWVDITAALLHNTRPLFPLPKNTACAGVIRPGLNMLPAPLTGVIENRTMYDVRLMSVMSCMGDLNALAALLQFELATDGDAVWDNEEQMAFITNSLSHQLLDQPEILELITPYDILSEALRLGAIIWIILVKRRCRSYPGTAQVYVSTLLKILSKRSYTIYVWNSPDLRLVRLWLLILCIISEPGDDELAAAVMISVSDIQELRWTSWDEAMSNIRQMPWVDMYEGQIASLAQLVEDYL